MITDIFSHRYPEYKADEQIKNTLFVQLFNIYNEAHHGLKKTLKNKIDDFEYSGVADEHIRIISESQRLLCNELGYDNLDKPHYKPRDFGYLEEYIFKQYSFDEQIDFLEKISLFEILFRITEEHLLAEISSLEANIPAYKERDKQIKEKYPNTNIYSDGEIKLEKALHLLEEKRTTLEAARDEINKRLRQHNVGLHYHNGYFQLSNNERLEDEIETPFWGLVSKEKYRNIEKDMLEAVDTLDNGGRDPAFYAAKALESMIKIICKEKNLATGKEKGAGCFINHLNSENNGSIISNDEKNELLAMFRTRNSFGHGAGDEKMPKLSDIAVRRYINSAMVWIVNLSLR